MRLQPYNGQSDHFSRAVINGSDRIDTPEPFEISTQIISGLLTGTVRNIDLRPGLSIEIFDQFHHIEFSKRIHFFYPSLRLVFYLIAAGRIERKQSAATAKDNVYEMKGGCCTLAFFPEFESIVRVNRETRFLNVVINISPDILSSFVDADHNAFPQEIRSIAQNSGKSDIYHIGQITASMQTALYEILNCPYSGTIRKIFLESKALELVAYKLAQIKLSKEEIQQRETVKRGENERIHHARFLLIDNMEEPPTLFELAQEVGLSHTRLNAGFKKIFGTTVFGCLQRIRLEHARYLMEKEGLNVTQAAFSVGYNSVPSFSRAFSHYFKQPPKRVMQGTALKPIS